MKQKKKSTSTTSTTSKLEIITVDPHNFEIQIPGLPIWLGSKKSIKPSHAAHLDFIVGLGESVNDEGFPLQFHLAWQDMEPLSEENSIRLKSITNMLIGRELTAGIFCFGGHGRTGTAAAYLMGLFGKYSSVEEIVKELRGFYCKEAVETDEQIKSLAHFLDLPTGNIEGTRWLSIWSMANWEKYLKENIE